MGTYLNIQLKSLDDTVIKKANDELEKLGFTTEVHNGVKYGAFVTNEQLAEDARFMNEDEEGLQQQPHIERPITAKWLQGFFWNKIGSYNMKLSAATREELQQAFIVSRWAANNPELIDSEKSDNYSPVTVISRFPKPENH